MFRKKIIATLCFSVFGIVVLSTLLVGKAEDTPAANAAMVGDMDRLVVLLKQGEDVNAAQGDGMTALHWAAFQDELVMAEVLIYAGANLEATTRVNAITPLFLAAQNGSASMVQKLLDAGAEPNSTMETGTTPLMLAAASGNAEVIN